MALLNKTYHYFTSLSQFLAMTNLKTTSRAEWNILKDSAAPWTDFETEYFMQVVPTSWIAGHSFDHFKALMEGRDASMKGMYFIIYVLSVL